MSATVGCGAAGAISVEPSSWSTPMTSRSSSSAWRAAVRMSPAVRSISAGGRSDRICSAPAWRVISDTRWATTSCISRAMRARSACRAWSASSRCSASARRARSCSDTTSCRRARTNIPHATTAANIAVVVTIKIHHGDRLAVDPQVLRAHEEEQPGGGDVEQADDQRRLHAAMHGNGEHGDRRGHRGGHREDRQQRRQDRDPDRETAAQPQRRTRDHPEHTVDNQHEEATGPAGRWPSRRGTRRPPRPTAPHRSRRRSSPDRCGRMCRHGWSSRRSSSSRDAGMRPGWSGPPAVGSTGTAPGMRSA